jgi:hypothetical protein
MMIAEEPPDRSGFERARQRAFWHKLFSLLTGHPKSLLSWESAERMLDARDSIDLGIRHVSLSKIVGSVERYRDFDRDFYPLKNALGPRWRAIYRARDAGVRLPPVSLCKVGEAYFVVDGHHRVSVARYRGVDTIEAKVMEATPRVPLAESLDADELELKAAQVRFLQRTRLDELQPDQQIEFTVSDGYEQLLEHIATHRAVMSGQSEVPVSQDEAVCDWYDRLYLPLVRVISENGVQAQFPHRTEADLYLWTVTYLEQLHQTCGADVVPKRAIQYFVRRYSRRLFKRWLGALRARFSDPVCVLVTREGPGGEVGSGGSSSRSSKETRS